MDSLTHIALGAVIGEAIAGKSLGKRAMVVGAIAQSVPDIDFVNSFFLDPSQNLLAHRGITHSFLFAVAATLLFTVLASRFYSAYQVSTTKWIVLFGTEILIHLVLDACNAYGVGWFEPFSHQRISVNLLYVADPLFSIWSGIAVIMLLVLKRMDKRRSYWVAGCLVLTSVYFLYALANKLIINNSVKDTLTTNRITYQRYFATPTPFNSLLWYFVAEADSGYYIGHRSVFDHSPSELTYFPKQKRMLDSLRQVHEVEELIKFSQGYYTVDDRDSTLVFNDLRFGQIMGWDHPEGKFVFRYYLQKPDENLLVMQRGRFTGWNRKTVRAMLTRIKGI